MVSLAFIFLLALDGVLAAEVSCRSSYSIQNSIHIFFADYLFCIQMFLQVWFCVEFLITATSCTIKPFLSRVDQHVVFQTVVPDEGCTTLFSVTNKQPAVHVHAQVHIWLPGLVVIASAVSYRTEGRSEDPREWVRE